MGNLALAGAVGEFISDVKPSERGWMVTFSWSEDGCMEQVEVVRQPKAVAAMEALEAAKAAQSAAWASSPEKVALDMEQAALSALSDEETTDVGGGSWSKQD